MNKRGPYTHEIYRRIMLPMINRGDVIGLVAPMRDGISYLVRPHVQV